MEATRASKPRIVIIDDNASVLSVLVTIVETLGYEANPANSGTRGLALIADTRPDLVILDLNMPGMSGQEVLDQLTRAELRPPVLVITGNPTPAVELDVRRRGAVGFLGKPIPMMALKQRIEAALRPRSG